MEFYTNIVRRGNRFWLRRITDSGKDVQEVISDYKPTLYTTSNEKTEYKNIYGQYLSPIKTGSLAEAKDLIQTYKDVDGFKLFGNSLWEYAYLSERFGNKCKYDASLIKTAIIDIETKVGENSTGFPYPCYSAEVIQLITHYIGGKYHVFSIKDFDIDGLNTIELDTVKHVFADEESMLRGYVTFWASDYPMAASGYNSESFDFPYLIMRIQKLLGDEWTKKLSPVGWTKVEFMMDDPKIVRNVIISGVELLDWMLLYKKYMPGKRSFKLDDMAQDFIGQRKVESKWATFQEFYENDWNTFVWYNVRDVDLVKRLDDYFGLLNLTYALAYLVGMNYSDVFGTCKPWEIFLQNEAKRGNMFISIQRENIPMPPRNLMGGFVHLYKPGLYRDGVTLDATSLYPTIMMSFNMSPEKFVHYKDVPEELRKYHDKNHIDLFLENGIPESLTELLQKYNMTMTMNGMFYRTDGQGFMPKIISEVFGNRKSEKNMMLKYESELELVEAEMKRRGITVE